MPSFLSPFLQQLSHRALASTFKRVGLYAAEIGLYKLVMPSWMQTPVRYTVLSTAGTASKQMFWWAVTPSQSPNESMTFTGSQTQIEELESLEFVVVNPTPSNGGYELSFKTIKRKAKQAAKDYVVNVTCGEVLEGLGGALGAGLATGAFMIFLGPPGLLMMPAYYLCEMPTKATGAFLGRLAAGELLGPTVKKSVIKLLADAAQPEPESLDESTFVWIDEPPANITGSPKSMQSIQWIENYDPGDPMEEDRPPPIIPRASLLTQSIKQQGIMEDYSPEVPKRAVANCF